jgi:hypothetical protein|tara:strand:+ start:109 stop:540 length:432 start_codon:yes stop_codon:yes gene_type:complete
MHGPFETALAAFRSQLAERWTATPIAWPNLPFDPALPGAAFAPGGPFLQWDVKSDACRFVTLGPLGGRLRRLEGRLQCYLLNRPGSGDSLGLAEELSALLSGKTFGELYCQAAQLAAGPEPVDQRRGWWQRQVTVPFIFYDRA